MPINYDNDYPKLMKLCQERGREIERLETLAAAWKESRDERVKEHLADKERIAELEGALQDIADCITYDYSRRDIRATAQAALKDERFAEEMLKGTDNERTN